MSDVPVLSISDLADGAADEPLLEPDGRVREPLMAVRLDAGDVDAETLDLAVARARASDRLLIGIAGAPLTARAAELAAALDLTVATPAPVLGRECLPAPEPEERLLLLHEAAVRNPHASIVLGQVLRAGETLAVDGALDLESFAYSTLLGGPEFRRWLDGRRRREVPSAHDPVIIDRDGDRLLVTLNRPDRRNAYSREVRDALVDALSVAVSDDTVTRVVLTGAGPCFCSGGDLDEFGTAPDLATAHLVRIHAGAGRLIHRLADRIEVRVHGTCVGAGIELPAFAGTVIADPGTTFRLPEVGMGLIPGAGGTVSIPRRIGRWRTLYLALSGEPIDAATALAWGLVDEVRPVG